MASEFVATTLGDVCREQGGAVQTGPFGSQLHASDYEDIGTPVVMPVNLIDGNVSESGIARVGRKHVDRLQRHRLKTGDIVFSRRGDVTRFALISQREEGWLCGTGCLKVSVGSPTIATPEYLAALLASPDVKEWLIRHAVGATMPNLNTEILGSLPITVPPIREQIATGSFLRDLKDRIDLLRQTNVTLEAIAQSLFTSWFVNFDPVRAKAEGREPEGMDAATAALFPSEFEESEFGLIPKGWRNDLLGDWLTVLETGRRPKGGVASFRSGVPSVGAENITRIGEYDFGKTKFIPEDFFARMKSGLLQSKDVLLYKDGGKPGVFLPRVSLFGDGFPFDVCAINEHVFRMRAKEQLGQPYLYFWMWSDAVMHELKHRGGKAAIPGINQTDVREQRVLVPDANVSQSFNQITDPIFSKILLNAKAAAVLSEVRDTLLPRLISGKLGLPDAEVETSEPSP